MTSTTAFGVMKAKQPVEELVVERRPLTDYDVLVKILYCGVCRSDQHHVDNDWHDVKSWPLIPGHEIIGVVEDIGQKVTLVKIGQHVCVGNMTDSCQACNSCAEFREQYCENNGPTWTYNGRERLVNNKRTLKPLGEMTYGGYSGRIVSQEKFVFILPKGLDLAKSAPLLCAGITMWYPLREFNMGPGKKVAIAAIGGLGALGLKFAKALGCDVYGLTTTPWKLKNKDAKMILMDDDFKDAITAKVKYNMEKPLTEREKELLKHKHLKLLHTFDLMINTIPISHDPTPYIHLVKPGGGKMHIVGNMNKFPNLKGMDFVFHGKHITSSNVGGTRDTKEMLKFCAKHNIGSEIEIIKPDYINTAMQRMVDKDVKYRFVMDLTDIN